MNTNDLETNTQKIERLEAENQKLKRLIRGAANSIEARLTEVSLTGRMDAGAWWEFKDLHQDLVKASQ